MSKKIAIDAGHYPGIFTKTGSKGVTYDGGKVFDEFDHFNKFVAKYAVTLLEENGFDVVMTQPLDKDVEWSLSRRVKHANKSNADLFISIHANASGNEKANGACSFVWHTSSNGKKLQDLWVKHAKENLKGVGLHGDGKHLSKPGTWSNFYVVRKTKMPAILVENGFFTSPKDREYLLDDDYRYDAAKSIAQAVCDFYNVPFKDIKEEHVEEPKQKEIKKEEKENKKMPFSKENLQDLLQEAEKIKKNKKGKIDKKKITKGLALLIAAALIYFGIEGVSVDLIQSLLEMLLEQ